MGNFSFSTFAILTFENVGKKQLREFSAQHLASPIAFPAYLLHGWLGSPARLQL
jgi:hypothetical protein